MIGGPFDRMAAAAETASDPDMVGLIADETDRDALIRIRRHAIRKNSQRVWVQLLSRRIADLTRDDAPTDFTKLIEILEGGSNEPT